MFPGSGVHRRPLSLLIAACALMGLMAASGGATATYDDARRQQLAAAKKDRPAAWLKAAEAFGTFLDAYPEHRLAPEARFGRAECLLAGGDADGAWRAYQELRRRGVGRREADLVGGEAFALMGMRAGDPDDVGLREDFLDKVGELLGLDGRHERLPPLLLAAARVFGETSREGEAEEALAVFVERWPDHTLAADAWDDLGALRVGLEDWDGAADAYRGYLRYAAGGEREPDIRCLLAYAYLQQGELADAGSAAESLLERLDPKKKDHDRRLWNETVKILAAAVAGSIDDARDVRQHLGGDEHPWAVDLLLASLAVHAAEGRGAFTLEGLELLLEAERLDLAKATDTVKLQLVSCCLALRSTLPDDPRVQQWLLVAADALDQLDRRGEAGEVLQWLRDHAADGSIRREARERQLRGE